MRTQLHVLTDQHIFDALAEAFCLKEAVASILGARFSCLFQF